MLKLVKSTLMQERPANSANFYGEPTYGILFGPERERFTHDLYNANGKEEVQHMLAFVSREFLERNSKGVDNVLISLKDLLEEANISSRNQKSRVKFAAQIDSGDVAVGVYVKKVQSGKQAGYIQRRYFLRRQDAKEAIFILHGNRTLT